MDEGHMRPDVILRHVRSLCDEALTKGIAMYAGIRVIRHCLLPSRTVRHNLGNLHLGVGSASHRSMGTTKDQAAQS